MMMVNVYRGVRDLELNKSQKPVQEITYMVTMVSVFINIRNLKLNKSQKPVERITYIGNDGQCFHRCQEFEA